MDDLIAEGIKLIQGLGGFGLLIAGSALTFELSRRRIIVTGGMVELIKENEALKSENKDCAECRTENAALLLRNAELEAENEALRDRVSHA